MELFGSPQVAAAMAGYEAYLDGEALAELAAPPE